ncbi:MAG: T9SS type A sorting domain-containing protein, partial [Bacteroidota bacterium]
VTDATGCTAAVADVANFSTFILEAPSTMSYQACTGGITFNGDLPDGFTQGVVTPLGDTLFGPDAVLTIPGNYQLLGFSPNNTCLATAGFFVFIEDGIIEPDAIFMAEIDSLNCGGFNCLGAFNIAQQNFANNQFLINWYLPDGTLAQEGQRTEFCNVTEVGGYTLELVLGCDTLTRTFEVEEPLPCSSITGTVFYEEEVNCTLDETEVSAAEILIQVQSTLTDEVYYTIADAAGIYLIEVPAGAYTITPLVNGRPPTDGCDPVLVNSSTSAVTTVDLFLPAVLSCPAMETWICMWRQRRCFENNMSVYYYNPTGEAVQDVVVTVEVDPFYTDISASIPIALQAGNVLTFNIGEVQPYERRNFLIRFTISCEAALGQTHCVRSIVTPNAICEEPPNWNGALVNIEELTCENDSLTLRVENIGEDLMSVPLNYVVVEDGIMMTTRPIEVQQLAAGEIIELRLPAEGDNYIIRTNQEPNAPVEHDAPTFVLQGCGPDGGTDGPVQGIANFFTLGNGVPWEDYVCRQNTDSFDPNDKRGFPLGYSDGQIASGTRIDYDIRFQNTGTDTAFTVIIQDTLPRALDLATLKIEGGSHDFTVDLDTNRVLTFTFADIILPDSSTNLLASQGMVSFSIDHDPSLEPGDLIENEAAIYFDFNEPIITNVSRHQIATEELPNSIRRRRAQRVALELFPNPVSGVLNIRLPQATAAPGDLLEIRDVYGRKLSQRSFATTTNGWDVSNLRPGYYVMILTDAKGVAKGRAGFVVAGH